VHTTRVMIRIRAERRLRTPTTVFSLTVCIWERSKWSYQVWTLVSLRRRSLANWNLVIIVHEGGLTVCIVCVLVDCRSCVGSKQKTWKSLLVCYWESSKLTRLWLLLRKHLSDGAVNTLWPTVVHVLHTGINVASASIVSLIKAYPKTTYMNIDFVSLTGSQLRRKRSVTMVMQW